MEHKCTTNFRILYLKNNDNIDTFESEYLYFEGTGWYYIDAIEMIRVNFCPNCGIKLESLPIDDPNGSVIQGNGKRIGDS